MKNLFRIISFGSLGMSLALAFYSDARLVHVGVIQPLGIFFLSSLALSALAIMSFIKPGK